MISLPTYDRLLNHVMAVGPTYHQMTREMGDDELTKALIETFKTSSRQMTLLTESEHETFIHLALKNTIMLHTKDVEDAQIEALLSFFKHPTIFFSKADYHTVQWSTKPFELAHEISKTIKHPLTGEDVTLYRLRYLVDAPSAHPYTFTAGQLGGWVSEDVFEAMHASSAVMDEAMVFDRVTLNEETIVQDYAMVFADVELGYEGVDVCVGDYVRIFNKVYIPARSHMTGMISIFTPLESDTSTILSPHYLETKGVSIYTGPTGDDELDEDELILDDSAATGTGRYHHHLENFS